MKAIKFVEFSVRKENADWIMKQSIRKTYKQLKWLKKETKDRIEQIGCTPFTGTS